MNKVPLSSSTLSNPIQLTSQAESEHGCIYAVLFIFGIFLSRSLCFPSIPVSLIADISESVKERSPRTEAQTRDPKLYI